MSLSLPFELYSVQREGGALIADALSACEPVVAVELPTGCGKTLMLLCAAINFQRKIKRMSTAEREAFFERCDRSNTRAGAEDEEWTLTPKLCDAILSETARIQASSMGLGGGPPKKRSREWLPAAIREERPPISLLYLSRTHAQLRQVIDELRSFEITPENPQDQYAPLRMNILASRDRYCVNGNVVNRVSNEGNNLGEVCDKLVSLGLCNGLSNTTELCEKMLSRKPSSTNRGKEHRQPPLTSVKCAATWQIEDLCREGVAMEACPYYAARELAYCADVTFATYNYFLDPIIRHETRVEEVITNHSLIIVDEAHNLPEVGREVLSGAFTLQTLTRILAEDLAQVSATAEAAALRAQHASGGDAKGNLNSSECFVPQYPRTFRLTPKYTLQEVMDFLYRLFEALLRFVREFEGTVDVRTFQRCFAMGERSPSAAVDSSFASAFKAAFMIVFSLGVTFNPFQFSVFGLGQMKRLLLLLRYLLLGEHERALTFADPAPFMLRIDTTPGTTAKQADKVLSIRCLDGGLAFAHLMSAGIGARPPKGAKGSKSQPRKHGVWSILLASGTLAPFDILSRELRLPRPLSEVLHNAYIGNHVADIANQCFVATLTHLEGSTGSSIPLHANYRSYSDDIFVASLARTIKSLCEAAGSALGSVGCLVFLPNSSIVERISTLVGKLFGNAADQPPLILVEGKTSRDFAAQLEAFRQSISSRGRRSCTVFFGPHRGKLSEGLDFTDSMARLVISVGVPFQPLLDPTVVAQRKYSGESWYLCDAVRAVNQAVGRCIRHKLDWGAIILLDQRFSSADGHSANPYLSGWLRSSLRDFGAEQELYSSLQNFFLGRLKLAPPRACSTQSQCLPANAAVATSCDKGKLKAVLAAHHALNNATVCHKALPCAQGSFAIPSPHDFEDENDDVDMSAIERKLSCEDQGVQHSE